MHYLFYLLLIKKSLVYEEVKVPEYHNVWMMQISCPKLDILNVVLITIATPPPHTVLAI